MIYVEVLPWICTARQGKPKKRSGGAAMIKIGRESGGAGVSGSKKSAAPALESDEYLDVGGADDLPTPSNVQSASGASAAAADS